MILSSLIIVVIEQHRSKFASHIRLSDRFLAVPERITCLLLAVEDFVHPLAGCCSRPRLLQITLVLIGTTASSCRSERTLARLSIADDIAFSIDRFRHLESVVFHRLQLYTTNLLLLNGTTTDWSWSS